MTSEEDQRIRETLGGLSDEHAVLKAITTLLDNEIAIVTVDVGDPSVVGESLHKLAGQLNGYRTLYHRIREYQRPPEPEDEANM